MKKFQICSREIILKNPWIPVERQMVILPNGERAEWFLALGKKVVVVVPMLKNGEIALQKAYKHGAGKIIFEFCAGIVESGENLKTAAARELAEETGFSAEKLTKIGEVFGNPTGGTTKYFYFLAENCEKKFPQKLDPAEQIENFSVQNIAAAKDFLTKNPSSAAAIAAICFVENFFKSR